MELRHLNTFTKIAELMSFSKAAEHLGYSQSTVTVQIKALENELNTKLFDRMGHKIMLTDSGRALLTYAKDLLLMEQKLKSIVEDSSTVKGVLRLGLVESICTSFMPDILIEYHKLYPDVEIRIITDINEKLLEMLKTNEVDLIFLIDKKICPEEAITAYEFEEKIVFVASNDLVLPHSEPLSLEDISKLPFILTEKDVGYRVSLNDLLAKHNLSLSPFLEIGDTSTIVKLVRRNTGVSLLPMYAVSKSIENGEVKTLDVDEWSVCHYAQLMYNRFKWMTPAMQKFISLTTETLNKRSLL